jgi:hypothetical protein
MSGKVQLYCNPATSEVAGEYPTLHEAIAIATALPPSPASAILIADGVILAHAMSGRCLLEQAGFERLGNEYNELQAKLDASREWAELLNERWNAEIEHARGLQEKLEAVNDGNKASQKTPLAFD